MSKYSDHLERTHKCIGDIALKEFHDANSVERLKKKIREVK